MQLPPMVMQGQSGSSCPDDLQYHHGAADFLPFMARDVVVVGKEEGVSACNLFCVGRRPHAYALA